MRSFLLASAALSLTVVFVGCDAPVDPVKPTTPPAVSATPEPGKPDDKMAPSPAPAPAPVEKPAADAPK